MEDMHRCIILGASASKPPTSAPADQSQASEACEGQSRVRLGSTAGFRRNLGKKNQKLDRMASLTILKESFILLNTHARLDMINYPMKQDARKPTDAERGSLRLPK